ncbi:phage virion morphogenesis protein [Novosphingobium sp. FGD1]|uniref:Phage virion morphogenesis protein n=1 Tax=Novosphingobium silvae TaxID=2692619 RepID=A0A7X4GD40_9SPHN|nr:phage virion morphogenesis protein [Novosphingobium silvae]MYL96438.1 phage virion morphogenesis protein [Novosphingobium silvae]
MADGFAELESFLTAEMAKLSPARRRRMTRKIGMEIRKANAKRIAENIQPDGTPMQARKPRRLTAGKGAIKRGRMFRKMRLARSFKINPSADGVSVGFEGIVAHTARAHHYGLADFVGRTEAGRPVRAKYPERMLLGFASEDLEAVTEIVLSLLARPIH